MVLYKSHDPYTQSCKYGLKIVVWYVCFCFVPYETKTLLFSSLGSCVCVWLVWRERD